MKLEYLDIWNNRRKDQAKSYSSALINHPLIEIPHVPAWAKPVWHLFVIRSPKRDLLQTHLEKNNIEIIIHYPIPPHQQACYKDFIQNSVNFPITENLANNILSLPIGPHLTEIQQNYVIECINNSWE